MSATEIIEAPHTNIAAAHQAAAVLLLHNRFQTAWDVISNRMETILCGKQRYNKSSVALHSMKMHFYKTKLH